MNVYKFEEPTNNFYYLVLSHVKDPELALEHFEHWCGVNQDEPMSKYLFDKWDDIIITKTDITPRQFLEVNEKSGLFYDSIKNDTKCINISTEFEKFIIEKKKRGAKKEPKEPKEPKPAKEPKQKKEAKPKAPKKTSGMVKIESGQVLNFAG